MTLFGFLGLVHTGKNKYRHFKLYNWPYTNNLDCKTRCETNLRSANCFLYLWFYRWSQQKTDWKVWLLLRRRGVLITRGSEVIRFISRNSVAKVNEFPQLWTTKLFHCKDFDLKESSNYNKDFLIITHAIVLLSKCVCSETSHVTLHCLEDFVA